MAWAGVEWDVGDLEVDIARRVLAFLEDRRVFYVSASLESPGHCATSVIETRRMLSDELGRVTNDSVLKANLRGIRAACHAFLEKVGPADRDRGDWMMTDPWGRAHFGVALGELRAVCGVHIAIIAATHHISVDGELAAILPAKLLDREV